MGLQKLKISCKTQNIDKIKLEQDLKFVFKIQCSNCYNEVQNKIFFYQNDEVENNGNTLNFKMKCKNCDYIINANIEKFNNEIQLEQTNENEYECKDFLVGQIQCRGINLIEWDLENQLYVYSTSGTKFQEIDLTDLPYCDYDEKISDTVQILDFKTII